MGGRGQADRRDFFISHAGEDQQWAEWIGQQLIGAGYTVELDVWEWAPGDDFVAAMQNALQRADRVLAVYSAAYFTKPFARAEHSGAFTAAVTSRPGRIVPVRADNSVVPELYASLIRIELAGLDEDEARRRLLAGVTGPASTPSSHIDFPGRSAAGPAAVVESAVEAEYPGCMPPIWNVPPRNPFFTGRVSLLDEIHHRLAGQDRGAGGHLVVPLQGMSGVGKSQLAVEYAYRHASDYRLVWWVHADNPALITTNLGTLAAALAIPSDGDGAPQALVDRLWVALRRRTDWLLIYDNVDNPADLADLRPPDSGRLLVTSRNPAIGRLAALVEVAEFDRAESILLLRHRCRTLSHDQANQIAIALGDLPLALEQAGCFLAETGLDVADYLRLLATQPTAAGLADPTIDCHPGLATVVATSLTRVCQASPPGMALLDKMAFLAPAPLLLSPTRDNQQAQERGRFGVQIGDAATTADVVRQLTGLALVRRTGAALQMHRLVQDLLRARLTPAQRTKACEAAQRLLASADPDHPDSPACWPAYAVLTPHVQLLVEHTADLGASETDAFRSLLLAVIRYLEQSGQYTTAHEIGTRTYQRWRQTLGADNPETLTAAHRMANTLFRLGEHAAARQVYEDTYARRRQLLGPDHPATLSSADALAAARAVVGEVEMALTLHQDTLARQRQMLGGDHPDTLAVAGNVANTLHALGDYAAARALDEDTLARRRRVLGDDHPSTLASAHSLAIELSALGEHRAARNLLNDTLARRRRVLGDDHPSTLASAHSLAIELKALGEHRAARNLLNDTLARRRRVLGDDHPSTLASAHSLADMYEPRARRSRPRRALPGTAPPRRPRRGDPLGAAPPRRRRPNGPLGRSYVIQGMRMLAVTWANDTRGKSVFWLHAAARRGIGPSVDDQLGITTRASSDPSGYIFAAQHRVSAAHVPFSCDAPT